MNKIARFVKSEPEAGGESVLSSWSILYVQCVEQSLLTQGPRCLTLCVNKLPPRSAEVKLLLHNH